VVWRLRARTWHTGGRAAGTRVKASGHWHEGSAMAHRKPHLPSKPCAACGRDFAWRKKWARVWEEVRFCSDACRDGRREAARRALAGGAKKGA
jgi:hypothetical protein